MAAIRSSAPPPKARGAPSSTRNAGRCKLPPEKYAIWKDLVVDFSPKDIL